jgi:hypothetical protein
MTDGLRAKLPWRRSSTCEGGACIEVTATEDAVMVRSSARPDEVLVAVSHARWREFLTRLKTGTFDRL